jgi:K+-transporting ATPase ATPase A chain
MSPSDIIQLVLFFIVLLAAVPLLGTYMYRVFSGQGHLLTRPLGWLERSIYRLLGIDPDAEMSWREYCKSLLVFNALGCRSTR